MGIAQIKTKQRKPHAKSKRTTLPLDKAKPHEVVWDQVSGLFTAARPIQNPSYVYIISEGDDGPVKIGLAKDPIARVRTMQTGNPRRLRIEYVLVGDGELEALMHEYWEDYAIRSPNASKLPGSAPKTEWFEPEIRGQLWPILELASYEQMTYLHENSGEIKMRRLEKIARGAHYANGFVAKGRDEIRVLAQGAGYARLSRKSRV